MLAAACVIVGRLEDARRHMAEFIRTYPQHFAGRPSARRVRRLFAFRHEADVDRLIQAMCTAGLPR